MKELSIMFLSGMFFGVGVCIGGLIAWMLVPNGKGLMERQKAKDDALMEILSEKNDILRNIADAIWSKK